MQQRRPVLLPIGEAYAGLSCPGVHRSVSGAGEVSFQRFVCRGSSAMNIVAFSPADDLLLVAGNDNVVRLYEVAAPAPVGAAPKQEYRHHKDAVSAGRGRREGSRGWGKHAVEGGDGSCHQRAGGERGESNNRSCMCRWRGSQAGRVLPVALLDAGWCWAVRGKMPASARCQCMQPRHADGGGRLSCPCKPWPAH